MPDPERAAGIAAVLGQVLESADLLFALDPGEVVAWQRLDQAANSVSHLQREVRRRGAGKGADVLDRYLVLGFEQAGAL
jgi:hypothetical protein